MCFGETASIGASTPPGGAGEEVTVTAYAAKDGSKHAWAGGLTRADGQTVITLGGIPSQGGGRGPRGRQQQ